MALRPISLARAVNASLQALISGGRMTQSGVATADARQQIARKPSFS
jgi:hypothetical protein